MHKDSQSSDVARVPLFWYAVTIPRTGGAHKTFVRAVDEDGAKARAEQIAVDVRSGLMYANSAYAVKVERCIDSDGRAMSAGFVNE